MNGYKISEAARATGFTVSALRFYEQEGVVVPERTTSGYRSYQEAHLEELRFVSRGKQLGLSLDEITELLALLDQEKCAPVQARIRHLIQKRIGQAHDQIAELVAFTAQLQQAAAPLGVHTPDGACDDRCGCRSDPDRTPAGEDVNLIPLAGASAGHIACSLSANTLRDRIDDWNRILDTATSHLPIEHGVRVVFDRNVDVGALAVLAAAEQTCCAFFEFAIGIRTNGVNLDVTGPEDAQKVITAVFGRAG